jgi:hypothetical protein
MNTNEKLKHIKVVMDGLEKINYNNRDKNTLSKFKISYKGLNILSNDLIKFNMALYIWLEIVNNQILGIDLDDYLLCEINGYPNDYEWINNLIILYREMDPLNSK